MKKGRTNLITDELLKRSRRRKAWAFAAIVVLAAGTAAAQRAGFPDGCNRFLRSRINGRMDGRMDGMTNAVSTPVLRAPAQVVTTAQRSTQQATRAAPAPAPLPALKKTPPEVADLESTIRAKFSASKTLVDLQTRENEGGLDIAFGTDRIFPGGSADFQTGSESDVAKLVSVIGDQAKNFQIEIEGYTDDVPIIKNRKRFKTNWELSGARAVAIVHLFEHAGVDKGKLEAIAYGASRPLYSQKWRNRRVVIHLVKTEESGS